MSTSLSAFLCSVDMDSGPNFKPIKLVKNPTLAEKIVSSVIKMIGYSILYVPKLPHLTRNGLKSTKRAFQNQSIKIKQDGEIIYRRMQAANGLLDTLENIKNVPEIFLNTVQRFSSKKFLGTRKLISVDETISPQTKKVIFKYELGDYEWISYDQALKMVQNLSCSLHNLGFNKNNMCALFSDTSADWLLSSLSLMSLGSPFVTVFSTLSDEAITYALNLTESVGILADRKSLKRIIALLPLVPFIQHIIVSSQTTFDGNSIEVGKERLVKVHRIADLYSPNHNFSSDYPFAQASKEDLAIIMFTSGSTGVPKGVMISHENLMVMIAGTKDQKEHWVDHVYPGYLPLAHVFEYLGEFAVLTYGGSIGYCSALTLFDNSPGLKPNCKGDFTLLRPTVLFVVPLLLERIRDGILEKASQESRMKQMMLETIYNMKAKVLSKGHLTTTYDKIFFKKITGMFGGRLRFVISGGAKLSTNTEEFVNVVLCTLKQSYGLTETCCGAGFSNISYLRPNNVGPPIACSSIKLSKWEEGGYDLNDESYPSGEILISGKHVSRGYYKDDDLTMKAFVKDPNTHVTWFHTGDIGTFLPDGTLRIIDRKKDIIKLKHGEYVSLAVVETALAQSRVVEYLCACPDDESNFLVAIVIPKISSVIEICNSLDIGLNNSKIDEVLKDERVKSAIIADITNTGVKNKLSKHDIPGKFLILNDSWTPENGILTPSFKVIRSKIASTYKHLF